MEIVVEGKKIKIKRASLLTLRKATELGNLVQTSSKRTTITKTVNVFHLSEKYIK